MLLRTAVEPADIILAVRAVIAEADKTIPFLGADPMETLVRRSSVEERYRTMLVSLFGVIAGVLAGVGMYGITSRAASRRTREMGIRIALGARVGSATRLLVGATMQGAVAGVVVGVIGAAAGARWLAPFLYGITPGDRLSYLGSIGLLATVSLAASWFPARRAARVSPATVLRAE